MGKGKMAFNYTVTTSSSTTTSDNSDGVVAGLVKYKNLVWNFDKQTGKVIVELDAKWNDGSSTSSNYYIKLYYASDLLYTLSIGSTQSTALQSTYKRYILTGDMSEYDNKDWGALSFSTKFYDTSSSLLKTVTQSLDIDLDPVEFHLTVLSDGSGTDTTPDIEWELSELLSEQKLVPTISVGASATNSLTVTFDDDTTVSGLTAGVVNHNNMKFEDSSLTFNSSDAGKAYWKNISKYKITAPTMTTGDNSYSINLNCTAV